MPINPINQSYFLFELRHKKGKFKKNIAFYIFSFDLVFKRELKMVIVVFTIVPNPNLIQLNPVIDIMDNAPEKLLINGNF